ncbi:indole-3-glycerol phosphate synthase TrpC [Paenibacillus sp. 1P07SE]|uniref:indole-3-glycerol phosphate synthase TrpC n=1 Tax=Paenibacillus sp. 1P07SE TaxID=3132209 RepID=UPI0039A61098
MFLDTIVAAKRREVERLAEGFEVQDYERRIAALPPCRGFEKALTERRQRNLGLIAEVKKASPSKGLIRADFDPVALARIYEEAGADCISVLTDVEFFQGSPDYLTAVSEAVRVPLLRKDFIIDHRQVYEARLMGADAILLIAAILSAGQLAEYDTLARSLGMDVLVEVHDAQELATVLEVGQATLIGVNNRDLRSFSTDLKTTERLIGMMPKTATVISESGIAAPEDIGYLESIGAHGVLIGESFMRQADVREAVDTIMGPAGVA